MQLTDTQKQIQAALHNGAEQIFVTGPAGTGKSYACALWAAQALQSGDIDRIVIIRPAVTAGEELGFLPGTLDEKLEPYVQPIIDILKQELGAGGAYTKYRNNGKIEFVSIAHARGRTFDRAAVILDEAQNCTRAQLKLILTRIGVHSVVCVNGDLDQADIRDSGLEAVVGIAKAHDLPVFEMPPSEVVRSAVCQFWSQHL